MVVDASIVIDLLLGQPSAGRISDEIRAAGGDMQAPHLLDAEVGQAVRRLSLQGRLPAERGLRALEGLRAMRITRYSHDFLLDRAFSLRENLTFYDGLYVALAEALGAPLLTADRAWRTVPGTTARIIVV